MLDQPVTKRPFRARYLFIPLIAVAAVLLFGAVVMLLWNAILPGVLGVPALTYWQAVGLLILCKILFSGWHGTHHDRFHSHPHSKDFGLLRERWMCMSEEERARVGQDNESRSQP